MHFNLIKYNIRVILNPYSFPPSSKNPIDVEGTALWLDIPKDSVRYYDDPQNLIKLFCTNHSGAGVIKIRWDNDEKSVYRTHEIILRSTKIAYWSSIWGGENDIKLNIDKRPWKDLQPQTIFKPITLTLGNDYDEEDIEDGARKVFQEIAINSLRNKKKKKQKMAQSCIKHNHRGKSLGSYREFVEANHRQDSERKQHKLLRANTKPTGLDYYKYGSTEAKMKTEFKRSPSEVRFEEIEVPVEVAPKAIKLKNDSELTYVTNWDHGLSSWATTTTTSVSTDADSIGIDENL